MVTTLHCFFFPPVLCVCVCVREQMTNLLIDAMFQYDDPNATISSILDEVRKLVSITVIVVHLESPYIVTNLWRSSA